MILTIFTALYNRKSYLPRLYASLKKQECKDFEWLIVDDGSNDSPEELIVPWMEEENTFPIRFFQKENGGKHSAANYALSKAQGDFFLFLDSDDYLTDDAVSLIKQWIHDLPSDYDEKRLLGIGGQKINTAGQYLLWKTANDGRQIPYGGMPSFDDTLTCTITERSDTYHMRGDCSEVFRTDILKQYPFPVFPGERFLAEDAVYSPMSHDGWKIEYHKEPLEVCEYQMQGLSYDAEKFTQNPKGWGYVIRVMECSEEERNAREYDYFHRLCGKIAWQEICENLGITDPSNYRQRLLSCCEKKSAQFPDIAEALTVYDNIQKQLDGIPKDSERYQTVGSILEKVISLLSSLDTEICVTATTDTTDSARMLLEKKRQDLEKERQFLANL